MQSFKRFKIEIRILFFILSLFGLAYFLEFKKTDFNNVNFLSSLGTVLSFVAMTYTIYLSQKKSDIEDFWKMMEHHFLVKKNVSLQLKRITNHGNEIIIKYESDKLFKIILNDIHFIYKILQNEKIVAEYIAEEMHPNELDNPNFDFEELKLEFYVYLYQVDTDVQKEFKALDENAKIRKAITLFFKKHIEINSYFRQITMISKFIQNNLKGNSSTYNELFLSQMSVYELQVLFYSSLICEDLQLNFVEPNKEYLKSRIGNYLLVKDLIKYLS